MAIQEQRSVSICAWCHEVVHVGQGVQKTDGRVYHQTSTKDCEALSKAAPATRFPRIDADAAQRSTTDSAPVDGKFFKDSGQRQSFDTGAVRDSQGGKGRFDLLPSVSLFLVSRIYEDGAKKYAENNWMKGIPVKRYIESAQRHLAKYLDGLRDEPHLSMAAWNVLCALWTAAKVSRGSLPAELGVLSIDAPPLTKHEEESLRYWYGS